MVTLSVQVLLEGPFDAASESMNAELDQLTAEDGTAASGLPRLAPYFGDTRRDFVADDPITDWVELVVVEATEPDEVVWREPALLRPTGEVVGADREPITARLRSGQDHLLQVYHRGHTPAISEPFNVAAGSLNVAIDMTEPIDGSCPGPSGAVNNLKLVEETACVLFAGDVADPGSVLGDGSIDAGDSAAIVNAADEIDYPAADVNLDGVVNEEDFAFRSSNNGIWTTEALDRGDEWRILMLTATWQDGQLDETMFPINPGEEPVETTVRLKKHWEDDNSRFFEQSSWGEIPGFKLDREWVEFPEAEFMYDLYEDASTNADGTKRICQYGHVYPQIRSWITDTYAEMPSQAPDLTTYDVIIVRSPHFEFDPFGVHGSEYTEVCNSQFEDAYIPWTGHPSRTIDGNKHRTIQMHGAYAVEHPDTDLGLPSLEGHEFGHTLGAGHGMAYDCVDDAGIRVLWGTTGASCSSVQADPFDLMSTAWNNADFRPYDKIRFGWLSPSTIQQLADVAADEDGAVILDAAGNQPGDAPKVIDVGSFELHYRAISGGDTNAGLLAGTPAAETPPNPDGVVVAYTSGSTPRLIDIHPGAGYSDSGATPGESFYLDGNFIEFLEVVGEDGQPQARLRIRDLSTSLQWQKSDRQLVLRLPDIDGATATVKRFRPSGTWSGNATTGEQPVVGRGQIVGTYDLTDGVDEVVSDSANGRYIIEFGGTLEGLVSNPFNFTATIVDLEASLADSPGACCDRYVATWQWPTAPVFGQALSEPAEFQLVNLNDPEGGDIRTVSLMPLTDDSGEETYRYVEDYPIGDPIPEYAVLPVLASGEVGGGAAVPTLTIGNIYLSATSSECDGLRVRHADPGGAEQLSFFDEVEIHQTVSDTFSPIDEPRLLTVVPSEGEEPLLWPGQSGTEFVHSVPTSLVLPDSDTDHTCISLADHPEMGRRIGTNRYWLTVPGATGPSYSGPFSNWQGFRAFDETRSSDRTIDLADSTVTISDNTSYPVPLGHRYDSAVSLQPLRGVLQIRAYVPNGGLFGFEGISADVSYEVVVDEIDAGGQVSDLTIPAAAYAELEPGQDYAVLWFVELGTVADSGNVTSYGFDRPAVRTFAVG